MHKKYTLMALAGAAVLAAGVGEIAYADRGGLMGQGAGDMGMMGMPMFDAIDADKNGALTEAEVDTYRAAQMTRADANADGKLDAAELVAMQEQARAEMMTERATRMITRFDTDADGLLSAAELAAGPRMQTIFERMDANSDGSVTAAEAEAGRDQMAGRMMRRGHHGPQGGPDMMPEN